MSAAGTVATDQPLTTREVEVIACYAAGHDRAQAAATLGISPYTVHSHLGRIRVKLGARSTEHAVALAVAAGLVHPGSDRPLVVVPGLPRRRPGRLLAAGDALEACARAAVAGRLEAAARFGAQALQVLDADRKRGVR